MIYFKERCLFLHIPRTSGVSITQSVMNHYKCSLEESPFIVAGSQIGGLNRHATGHQLRLLVPDFHKIEKVAVIRNPWRIAESHYRYFSLYKSIYHWGYLPFDQFVVEHFAYLADCGGFWNHWCNDWDSGLEFGVRPFKYERLDEPIVWNELTRILNIPGGTRVKNNEGVTVDCHWTDEAIDFYRTAVAADIHRFGYPSDPDVDF